MLQQILQTADVNQDGTGTFFIYTPYLRIDRIVSGVISYDEFVPAVFGLLEASMRDASPREYILLLWLND